MTIRATFVKLFRPRSDSGFPDLSQPFRLASAEHCGPAPITATTPSDDGLALLQARRLVLLTEARRLRDLRRSKDASMCEAELRDVTHRILSRRVESFPGGFPC